MGLFTDEVIRFRTRFSPAEIEQRFWQRVHPLGLPPPRGMRPHLVGSLRATPDRRALDLTMLQWGVRGNFPRVIARCARTDGAPETDVEAVVSPPGGQRVVLIFWSVGLLGFASLLLLVGAWKALPIPFAMLGFAHGMNAIFYRGAVRRMKETVGELFQTDLA